MLAVLITIFHQIHQWLQSALFLSIPLRKEKKTLLVQLCNCIVIFSFSLFRIFILHTLRKSLWLETCFLFVCFYYMILVSHIWKRKCPWKAWSPFFQPSSQNLTALITFWLNTSDQHFSYSIHSAARALVFGGSPCKLVTHFL